MAFGGGFIPKEWALQTITEAGVMYDYDGDNGTRAPLARGDVVSFLWKKAAGVVTLKLFVNGVFVDDFNPGPDFSNSTGAVYVAKRAP